MFHVIIDSGCKAYCDFLIHRSYQPVDFLDDFSMCVKNLVNEDVLRNIFTGECDRNGSNAVIHKAVAYRKIAFRD